MTHKPLSLEDAKYIKMRIKELHTKKARTEHQLFLVEGKVSVSEFLDTPFIIQALVGTRDYFQSLEKEHHEHLERKGVLLIIVSPEELSQLSSLTTNHQVIALVEQFHHDLPTTFRQDEKILMLDRVNDPGNLGTIIRIADWYGITHIICSPDTVDCYNAKVVSATKGSLARVQIHYTPLVSFLETHNHLPVLGADLEGVSLVTFSFPEGGILLMGSESHGIDHELVSYLTQRITIPRYGSAESLNVGIATAVILDRWKSKG